jgi:hypothetical protein
VCSAGLYDLSLEHTDIQKKVHQNLRKHHTARAIISREQPTQLNKV